MKPSYLGLLCGVLGVLLLLWPSAEPENPDPPAPPPVVRDLPAQAFDTYEQLWRKLAKDAADRLDAGEFKTDKEVWDFLAKGQEPARRVAFEPLAKSEQDYFDSKGGWSSAAHSALLRSYVK
jgi:hypothetical protein